LTTRRDDLRLRTHGATPACVPAEPRAMRLLSELRAHHWDFNGPRPPNADVTWRADGRRRPLGGLLTVLLASLNDVEPPSAFNRRSSNLPSAIRVPARSPSYFESRSPGH